MMKMYNKTPSDILKINDDYTAYCLDEAMVEFIVNIEKGEKPIFKVKKEILKNKTKGHNPGLKILIGRK